MKRETENTMHVFRGSWITDGEFASLRPRQVFHRQLEPLALDCTAHRDRHILFRRSFRLDRWPERACLFITADDSFKAYLNGRFVCQGPAPAYPQRLGYLEADVTSFLQPGRNVLAVHTLYQGLINRVWVSGDLQHGLLCDLEADGALLLCSDSSFLTHPHTGYREIGTVGYDTQFLEDYDSAAPEAHFFRPEFEDAAWPHAQKRQFAHYHVVPQRVQPLVWERIAPLSLERRDCGDGSTVLLADFGACYVGTLRLIGSGPKGSRAVIRCAQELQEEDPHRIRYDMRCNCRYEEGWLFSGSGTDALDWFDFKSFRYAEIVLPPGCEAGEIALDARHAPFALQTGLRREYEGEEELRRIWNLCVHTQRYGAQEVLQDCMDREKGFYLGDGCYTCLTRLLLTGEDSQARKLIGDAFLSLDLTPGIVTCLDCAFMQEIAEFPLILISFVLWHYRCTGDLAYLRQNSAGVRRILDAYETYRRPDGLLGGLDRWCVVEWPAQYRDGYDVDLTEGKVCEEPHVVLNAYALCAIACANRIAALLGQQPFRQEETLRQSFYDAFYDPARHLFRDRPGSDHVSYIGNVLPYAFGLSPEPAFESAVHDWIEHCGVESLSLFGTFPLLAALRDRGEEALLRRLLKSPGAWLRMLSEGATATFECWGKNEKWNTSLFHMTFSYAAVFLAESGRGLLFYR